MLIFDEVNCEVRDDIEDELDQEWLASWPKGELDEETHRAVVTLKLLLPFKDVVRVTGGIPPRDYCSEALEQYSTANLIAYVAATEAPTWRHVHDCYKVGSLRLSDQFWYTTAQRLYMAATCCSTRKQLLELIEDVVNQRFALRGESISRRLYVNCREIYDALTLEEQVEVVTYVPRGPKRSSHANPP